MLHPTLLTTEQKNTRAVLIIDSKGIIGEGLAHLIKQAFNVVLATKTKPKNTDGISHTLFTKKTSSLLSSSYAYIIIIDEDCSLEKKELEKVFKKSKIDNTNVFLGVKHALINEKLFRETVLKYENIKLGIFGDIVAESFIFDAKSKIGKLILNIKQFGKIDIENSGAEELFPVLLTDVLDAILEICFNTHKEKTYYILPKTPISMLSLATTFKKNYPDIKLDFYKSKKRYIAKKIILKGNYILGEDYSFLEKIKKITLKSFSLSQKDIAVKDKNRKEPVFFTSLFFLTLLFLPLVTSLFSLSIGKLFSEYALNYLIAGDNIKAEIFASSSQKLLYASLVSTNILKQETQVFNNKELLAPIEAEIKNYYLLSSTYYDYSVFLIKLNSVMSGISTEPKKDLDKAIESLKNSNYNFDLGAKNYQDRINFEKFVNTYRLTSSTAAFWSDIFGISSQRSYLIVVKEKENTEVAKVKNKYLFLKINNGKIYNFQNDLSFQAAMSLASSDNINGIVSADKLFVLELEEYRQKNNLISINFLDFLARSLKEKHLLVFFTNPLEQAIMFSNGFSSGNSSEVFK